MTNPTEAISQIIHPQGDYKLPDEIAEDIVTHIQANIMDYAVVKELEWGDKTSTAPEPNTADAGGWSISSGDYTFKYSHNTWRTNKLYYKGRVIIKNCRDEAAAKDAAKAHRVEIVRGMLG